MPKIEFILLPDGRVEIDGQEFEGDACEKLIQKYIKALGQAEDIEKKPEYLQEREQNNRETERE